MKPFLVTIEIEYAAYAETEEEARQFAREAIQDTAFIEDCCYASKLDRIPDAWNLSDIVYCEGNEITLKELLDKSDSYKAAEKRNTEIQKQLQNLKNETI